MVQQITKRTPEYRIYQGDDADRLMDLAGDLKVAERAAQQDDSNRRVGDVLPSVTEAREALESFIDEAAERAFIVRYQHIGNKRFRDLVAAHPPRQIDSEPDEAGAVRQIDHPDDRLYKVNSETFPYALLTYRDPGEPEIRTILEPDHPDAADLQRFIEVDLAGGDLYRLWTRVYELNRGATADPFEVRASLHASRSTPATSESGTSSD